MKRNQRNIHYNVLIHHLVCLNADMVVEGSIVKSEGSHHKDDMVSCKKLKLKLRFGSDHGQSRSPTALTQNWVLVRQCIYMKGVGKEITLFARNLLLIVFQ